MHYSPVSYYSLGRVFPRTRTRETYGSATNRRTFVQIALGPAAPTNLVATAGASSVILTWDAYAGSPSLTQFIQVDYGIGSFTDIKGSLALNSTGTTVTGLTPGQLYQFKITVVDDGGNPISDPSSTVTATPLAASGGGSNRLGLGLGLGL